MYSIATISVPARLLSSTTSMHDTRRTTHHRRRVEPNRATTTMEPFDGVVSRVHEVVFH